MCINSDIEYSDNEKSDCDDETYFSDAKESPKLRKARESKKEDSAEMDVDTDDDFIKWSFGKDRVIPERTFTGVNGPTQIKKLSWSLPKQMGMYMIGSPIVQLKSERGLLQLCGIA